MSQFIYLSLYIRLQLSDYGEYAFRYIKPGILQLGCFKTCWVYSWRAMKIYSHDPWILWFHKIRHEDISLKFTSFADPLLSTSHSYDSESECITWPHIYWMFRVGSTPCLNTFIWKYFVLARGVEWKCIHMTRRGSRKIRILDKNP